MIHNQINFSSKNTIQTVELRGFIILHKKRFRCAPVEQNDRCFLNILILGSIWFEIRISIAIISVITFSGTQLKKI